VPGQVIRLPNLDYMDALETREIHVYHRQYGYQVFTPEALALVEQDKRG